MHRPVALLLIFLLAAPLAFAGKKKGTTLAVRAGKKADLALAPTTVARQHCENWAWAAALESSLRAQDAAQLDQTFWITRINGGTLCLPQAGTPDELIRALQSDYFVLDDGRKLRLDVRYAAGPPRSVDDLIASVQRNAPLIVFWRGHAFVLTGITYDEYIGPNGARMFEARELRLADPYIPANARDRIATFTKGTDDMTELDGLMQVRVVWQ